MNWLRELCKSSYTRLLEAECARLRNENRALLNTLLGRFGVDPVESGGMPPGPPVIRKPGLTLSQTRRKTERESMAKLQERARADRAGEPPKDAA